MVVKLKSYRLVPYYFEQTEFNILTGMSLSSGRTDRVYWGSKATLDQMYFYDNYYGLRYKRLWGTNPNGGRTGAIVIVGLEDPIYRNQKEFFTTGWSNGNPVNDSIYMSMYAVPFPITADFGEEITVTEDLIEDTLSIVKQIESIDKFDLRVSRASFSLSKTDAIKNFLDKYWNPNGYLDDEYLLIVHIEGEFWGYCNYDNINYDEITETYFFDAYDPIKWLENNIWSLRLPSMGVLFWDLNSFLERTCWLFNTTGQTINIDVDASQTFNVDYQGGSDPNFSTYYTMDEHLDIKDFMIELMKHYGAVMYFDGDGNFNFVKRAKVNETNYQDVLLDELNKSYEGAPYSGLIVNVYESSGNWSYTGWSIIREVDGELVDQQLTRDTDESKYLDLRQELPEKIESEYRLFAPRTKQEVFDDYRELLKNSVLYETTLLGTAYNLYDTVIINSEVYVINYINIDYIENTSQVRVYKKI